MNMSEMITDVNSAQEALDTADTAGSAAQATPQALLEQLLKPEIQNSLTALIEQLPKLTEMMSTLTQSYDFVKTLANDATFKSDMVGAIAEIGGPVKESAKAIAANVIEAKDRAEASQETIGMFGLLKLLKDPEAQRLFRFVQAYLQVSGEKRGQ